MINCRGCAHPRLTPVANILGARWYLCLRCTLFQSAEVRSDLAEVLQTNRDYPWGSLTEAAFAREVASAGRYWDEMAAWAKLSSQARVLDLGCGDGPLLTHLRERRQPCVGLEPSSTNVERCQSAGLECVNGFLSDTTFAPQSFDVVHLHHVALYIPDLDHTFWRIRRLLRPGGFVFWKERVLDWNGTTLRSTLAKGTHLVQYFSKASMDNILRLHALRPAHSRSHFGVHYVVAKVQASELDPVGNWPIEWMRARTLHATELILPPCKRAADRLGLKIRRWLD